MAIIRNIEQLTTVGLLSDNSDEQARLQQVAKEFSIAITDTMQAQIDQTHDPIYKQFIPNAQELLHLNHELSDPIGDDRYSPVTGIVHRHNDRCLLMPMLLCPVYCRFCFRKEKIGPGQKMLNDQQIENTLQYIQQNNTIWEVILTGGDPLFLNANTLKKIIKELNKIEHVQVIRLHTRVPVVAPKRITEDIIASLKTDKALYIVIHSNHCQEWTIEAKNVCALLVNNGIPLLSQTVLLKGINDNIQALTDLMKYFVANRIKPYYLHHLDLVRGSNHFRTSIDQGQELIAQLRAKASGLCQPQYVLDIPGGYGKVPIGPNYIERLSSDYYELKDYQGHRHHYTDVYP